MTGGVTTKLTVELLEIPATVTMTDPVEADIETLTLITVSLQLVIVPSCPLNFTVLVPWVAPKPLPLIWTGVPGEPLAGLTLFTATPPTVNPTLVLLATPPATTSTSGPRVRR